MSLRGAAEASTESVIVGAFAEKDQAEVRSMTARFNLRNAERETIRPPQGTAQRTEYIRTIASKRERESVAAKERRCLLSFPTCPGAENSLHSKASTAAARVRR